MKYIKKQKLNKKFKDDKPRYKKNSNNKKNLSKGKFE